MFTSKLVSERQLESLTKIIMGLFDKFKKNQPEQEASETLVNEPLPLIVKLFYTEKPKLDPQQLLREMRKLYPLAYLQGAIGEVRADSETILFAFPECDSGLEVEGVRIPAHCSIVQQSEDDAMELPAAAYQQNWEWKEAAAVTAGCKYAMTVNDMMTGHLDYKLRHQLFMSFLAAVIEATSPASMYSYSAEKLVNPVKIAGLWARRQNFVLEAVMNVRLFNITGSVENDMIMDTLGLNRLGLPDLQIRFSQYDANAVGLLLWNYAYYIADNGDIIEDGNTMGGPGDEIWGCLRTPSLIGPERMVINIVTG